MIGNIEFSEDWLIQELIKTDFREKETGKVEYIKISKKALYKLFIDFIKLNRRGA